MKVVTVTEMKVRSTVVRLTLAEEVYATDPMNEYPNHQQQKPWLGLGDGIVCKESIQPTGVVT